MQAFVLCLLVATAVHAAMAVPASTLLSDIEGVAENATTAVKNYLNKELPIVKADVHNATLVVETGLKNTKNAVEGFLNQELPIVKEGAHNATLVVEAGLKTVGQNLHNIAQKVEPLISTLGNSVANALNSAPLALTL